MDKCPISKVFHGGDCCNGQDDLIQFFVNCMRATSPFGFYSTMGNHEYMNVQTDSSLYSYFSWFNNNQIGSVNDRNYYYVDNVQQKIRYVVLNAFAQSEKTNNKDSNGNGVLSEGASDGYENEQLVWLQNEALNVDSTWTIIIVTHVLANIVMANDAIYYDANAAKAYQVLNEHNQKSDKGKIAFVIHGHTHRDRLVLSNGKIPIVITTCDACIAYDNDINVDRSAGTINEQAFDVVVVDKKKKNAIAVRIGAPALDGVNEVPGSAVEERIVTWS
jgi:3',5'-cyclic AMP phosphodiesterase CpdA